MEACSLQAEGGALCGRLIADETPSLLELHVPDNNLVSLSCCLLL